MAFVAVRGAPRHPPRGHSLRDMGVPLLLDEVMAAGDAVFIDGARKRTNDLMERASIVVFATNSLDVLP